ncbi:MAG: hypothetical protein PVH19_12970 [Planctomycetia bacterium]|jgi:hypothetical protein
MSKPDYEILSAYLDGQLTDEERVRAEQLLEEDAEARRLLEELREVSRTVSALPRHALPADFAERIETSLTVKPREEQAGWDHLRRRFLSGRSLAWVAVILVAAFGLNYFLPDPAEQTRDVAWDNLEENRDGLALGSGVDNDEKERNGHAKPREFAMHALPDSGVETEGDPGNREGSGATPDHGNMDSIPTLKGSHAPSGTSHLAMEDTTAEPLDGHLKSKSTNRTVPEGVAQLNRSGKGHSLRYATTPQDLNLAQEPSPELPKGPDLAASPSVPPAGAHTESKLGHADQEVEAGSPGTSQKSFGMGGMGGMSNNAVPPSSSWGHDPGLKRGARPNTEHIAGVQPPQAAPPTPNSTVPPREGTVDKPTERPTYMRAQAGERGAPGHRNQRIRPEIVVVCEVEKPAETARAFNRLLAKNRVEPKQVKKLMNQPRMYSAPPDKGKPELDSGAFESGTLRFAKEELMVQVNWDQAVELLKAVKQDEKQFLSVQASALPGASLPKPLAPFNRKRTADKVAVQETVGNAAGGAKSKSFTPAVPEEERAGEGSEKSQADATGEIQTAEEGAVASPQSATVEYRIRFIFRQAPRTALE